MESTPLTQRAEWKRAVVQSAQFWGMAGLVFSADIIFTSWRDEEIGWKKFYRLASFTVVGFVLELLFWRSPPARQFRARLAKKASARFQTRSAKTATGFVVVCGLFSLLFTGSSGWATISDGWLVSAILGIILWLMMYCWDILEVRAKTQKQTALYRLMLVSIVSAASFALLCISLWRLKNSA